MSSYETEWRKNNPRLPGCHTRLTGVEDRLEENQSVLGAIHG